MTSQECFDRNNEIKKELKIVKMYNEWIIPKKKERKKERRICEDVVCSR